MALMKSAVTSLFVLMALCGVSMGDVYKVGDSAGWTNTVGHIDFMKWAATKNFKVGDTIVFEYNTKFHNVLEVTHESFKSCNAKSPMATYKSGNDSITIKRPGHFFYICGLSDHCQAGQKVDIRVPMTPGPVLPSLTPAEAPHGSSPASSHSSAPSPGPSSSSAPPSLHSSSMGLYAIQLAVLSMVVLAVCFNGFAYY